MFNFSANEKSIRYPRKQEAFKKEGSSSQMATQCAPVIFCTQKFMPSQIYIYIYIFIALIYYITKPSITTTTNEHIDSCHPYLQVYSSNYVRSYKYPVLQINKSTLIFFFRCGATREDPTCESDS